MSCPGGLSEGPTLTHRLYISIQPAPFGSEDISALGGLVKVNFTYLLQSYTTSQCLPKYEENYYVDSEQYFYKRIPSFLETFLAKYYL